MKERRTETEKEGREGREGKIRKRKKVKEGSDRRKGRQKRGGQKVGTFSFFLLPPKKPRFKTSFSSPAASR
jgi:hypothetical protein